MSLGGSRRVCTPSFYSTQGKKIAKEGRRGREERTVIALGFLGCPFGDKKGGGARCAGAPPHAEGTVRVMHCPVRDIVDL